MLFAHLGFFISFLKLYKSSPWFCNTVLKLDFQKMIPGTEKEREREGGGEERDWGNSGRRENRDTEEKSTWKSPKMLSR